MTSTEHERPARRVDYDAVHDSASFAELRYRLLIFVVPATAWFLTWYFSFVLLAAFAPDVMATRVIGRVNLGLLLGLSQFVSTFVVTAAYSWWARNNLDPLTAWMRDRIRAGASL